MTLKFNCSSDDTIATVVVTLREKQQLLLRMQVESTLGKGQVQVNFNDQNYSIFYIKTLRGPPTPTTIMDKPTTMVNTNNTSSENITGENNTTVSAVSIAIIAAVALMLLILTVLLIIIIQLRNKQKSKSTSKHECNFQINFNTGSKCPSSNLSSNNGCTFRSSSDTGSPVSDTVDGPLSSNTIQLTDNSNTDFPSDNITIPAVSSSTSSKHSKHVVMKTNQINSVSKLLGNIQSASDQHGIHWEQNEIYAILNPHESAGVYKSPAIVPKSSVNAEAETDLYDDIEGINESRRRTTVTGHTHHNVQPRPPASESRVQYPHGNCNVVPVNTVTISKAGAIHT